MSRSTYAKDHRRDRPEKEERRRNRRAKIAARQMADLDPCWNPTYR